jgi:hypothetical protein
MPAPRKSVEAIRVGGRLFLAPVEALPNCIAEMTDSGVPLQLHRYPTPADALAHFAALRESCTAPAH